MGGEGSAASEPTQAPPAWRASLSLALPRKCPTHGGPAPKAQKGAAPEWMNCPTLDRVCCLPLHSPAYLDLTPHPLNGPQRATLRWRHKLDSFCGAAWPGTLPVAESIPSATASPTLSVSNPGSPTKLAIPAHPRNNPGLPWSYTR